MRSHTGVSQKKNNIDFCDLFFSPANFIMGGCQDLPKLLRPTDRRTHTIKGIRNAWAAARPQQAAGGEKPMVGVDISILLVRAVKKKASADQFHARPPIAVTNVAKSLSRVVGKYKIHFYLDTSYTRTTIIITSVLSKGTVLQYTVVLFYCSRL